MGCDPEEVVANSGRRLVRLRGPQMVQDGDGKFPKVWNLQVKWLRKLSRRN